MRIVNVHEAKTHLSRLIAEALQTGEPFLIARAGAPVVEVAPLGEATEEASFRLGFLKGMMRYPEDPEELMHAGDHELAEMFEVPR